MSLPNITRWIQVFPDEYHLQTCEALLNACPNFSQPSVVAEPMISHLMQRLSNYAASGAEVLTLLLWRGLNFLAPTTHRRVLRAMQLDNPDSGRMMVRINLSEQD